MSLAGQVAIVTGGGHNVGRAIAIAFASAGARVAVASRRRDRLDGTVRQIEQAGGQALAVPADVTDRAQVEALVARTQDRFGPVDCLAAIAGGAGALQPIDAVDPAAWEAVLRVNLVGTFLCARAVLPGMRERGRGVILACTGGGAYFPLPGLACTAYACAKAAIGRFTDQLTAELLDTAIRVNALDPGQVPDPEVAGAWDRADPAFRRTPQAAAELALWLASAASEPLRGRLVSVYDTFWREPGAAQHIERSVAAWRLRRCEP